LKKKLLLPKIYIGVVMALLYLPVIIVMVYSFNESEHGVTWTGTTLHWYREMARDRRMLESLWKSLEVAAITCVISSVLGTMGAMAVSRYSAKTRRKVSFLMYIPIIIPEIILGVALLMFFSVTPLSYGVGTMVLSHTTFCIPYVFIMVSIRLRGMDPSLTEAARDLGAGAFRAFRTITLPLIRPAILSGVLISAAMSLDDVVISALVSGPESMTLPIRIFNMLRIGVTPRVNALSTIMIFVMFTMVGLLQFFSKGNRKSKNAG